MPGVAVGETVAGYRIEAVAGRGGMGVVYRAVQIRLERTVAFKVITPGFAGHSDYRARFQREARLAASIEHPNVLPVYEAGELASGELYLAMRWVDGSDLRELLAREHLLEPQQAVGLLAPVARALHAAHARGLVHRDVKPANILIGPGGEPYLTDFGIARGPSEEPELTRTGAFVGSVAYAAPERVEGGRGGPASDMYALGCVLFETLTGHVPYDRGSEVATMNAHLDDPIPSVCEEAPFVPRGLDEVVRIALAKSPGDRFVTAEEMADAIEAGLADTGARAGAAARGPIAGPPGATRPRTRARARARVRIIGLGVVVAGALAGLAVALASGGGGGGNGATSSSTAARTTTSAATPAAASIRVAAIAELPRAPGAVAIDGGDVVVAEPSAGRVVILHLVSGRPATSIAVGTDPRALAVDRRGRVWVADAGSGDVRVIDPRGPRTIATVPVGRAPSAIAIGGGSAWVADRGSGDVRAIDLATLRAGVPVATGGHDPAAIAYGSNGTVWVANQRSSDVSAIRSGRALAPQYIRAGVPVSIAAGPSDDAWVGTANGLVVHLGADALVTGTAIALRSGPVSVAVVGTTVWAVSRDDATLASIPATGRPAVGARVRLAPVETPAGLVCEPHRCVVSDAASLQLVAATF